MTKLSRRQFLHELSARSAAVPLLRQRPAARINRAQLVRRHNPSVRRFDPLAPLSVGNGEFAFTADLTGLQTFPALYETALPLCTMTQWGWHTTPARRGVDPKKFRLTEFDTHGRPVGYPISSDGQQELFNWLRENPHRLHLGQLGWRLLRRAGQPAQATDLTDTEQELDLWTGLLTSRFKLEGVAVTVRTAAHPTLDCLAVSVESPLLAEKRLALRLAFPYGSSAMHAAEWQQPDRHRTVFAERGRNGVELERQLDADRYFVTLRWQEAADLTQPGPHEFLLTPQTSSGQLRFIVAFNQLTARLTSLTKHVPRAAEVFAASAQHWQKFWQTGAAVELADSRDPRAPELERRVVLSQYLTAIQCAGSLPPQETGLTVNSWYGKFHLEMHWWHAAHFPLWQRLPLLERSLAYYDRILPSATAWARAQGYAGARWPKMTAPDGRDSPSAIGPLLIWQQPHPIFYAELCYLARPTQATLQRYAKIVQASAEFMASFAHYEAATQRYVLGPPVIPAQENHPPRETWNPTFELAYWRFGLATAQRWRQRLGLAKDTTWERVSQKLAALPVRDGVYLAHENCPQTFTERNRDHPSMLGALGVLPGAGVDRETMRRTLQKTMREWRWEDTWGWDYPLTALTAARLGETKTAVDALLLETPKNRYLPNGHNYQRANLPCYLPGNGGLLYAVALMAAGWRGAPSINAPGFPSDGSWKVRWEGFNTRVLQQL